MLDTDTMTTLEGPSVENDPLRVMRESWAEHNARDRRFDGAIFVGFAVLTLVVHPVDQVFSRPYWIDEAWVADAARAPWWHLVRLGSSTPPGFLGLVKLVQFGGEQRYRVVPLLFAMTLGGLAYLFVKRLDWRSRFEARSAGIIAGAAVVLSPSALMRNDLKQYTADAACALLLLIVATDAERRSDRHSLVVFGAVVACVLPFSTVSAFVSVPLFGGLLLSALLRGERNRVRDILICGGIVGAAVLVWLVAIVLPHDSTTSLRDFWHLFYLTGGPAHILGTAWHLSAILPWTFGLPAVITAVLFGIGAVVLWTRQHVAVAVAAVALWIEMFALGVFKRYPFLDVRTSTFLLVISIAVAAVGFTSLAFSIARRRHGVIVAITIACIAWFAFSERGDIRRYGIPPNDTRSQARYVAQYRQPDDVVLVNFGGNWGFTYYWPGTQPKRFITDPVPANGFFTTVEGINEVYARSQKPDGVMYAAQVAYEKWKQLGGKGRIWVVRSHVSPIEYQAWQAAFRQLGLHPKPATDSHERLYVVDPNSP